MAAGQHSFSIVVKWNPFNHTADSLVFVYLRQYLHYDLQIWPILCVNTSANSAKWISRGVLTTYRTSAVQRYVTNLLRLLGYLYLHFGFQTWAWMGTSMPQNEYKLVVIILIMHTILHC